MGLFKQTQAQKEKKAFRKIVAKQSTQAARKAFSDEAIKVAVEKAKARARKPSIGELLAKQVKGTIKKKISRTTTKRRTKSRRVTPQGPMSLNEAIFGVK